MVLSFPIVFHFEPWTNIMLQLDPWIELRTLKVTTANQVQGLQKQLDDALTNLRLINELKSRDASGPSTPLNRIIPNKSPQTSAAVPKATPSPGSSSTGSGEKSQAADPWPCWNILFLFLLGVVGEHYVHWDVSPTTLGYIHLLM